METNKSFKFQANVLASALVVVLIVIIWIRGYSGIPDDSLWKGGISVVLLASVFYSWYLYHKQERVDAEGGKMGGVHKAVNFYTGTRASIWIILYGVAGFGAIFSGIIFAFTNTELWYVGPIISVFGLIILILAVVLWRGAAGRTARAAMMRGRNY